MRTLSPQKIPFRGMNLGCCFSGVRWGLAIVCRPPMFRILYVLRKEVGLETSTWSWSPSSTAARKGRLCKCPGEQSLTNSTLLPRFILSESQSRFARPVPLKGGQQLFSNAPQWYNADGSHLSNLWKIHSIQHQVLRGLGAAFKNFV